MPWLVVDPDGDVVEPIQRFLRDFVARGNRAGSVRSYAYGLLRWWRWLEAVGVDHYERTTGPLLPHLFQRALGARREVISPGTVYKLINTALAAAGLKDAAGQPLAYRPHDFRRCFTTAAVTGGLPVHIAARLLGHKSLTTTETYMAVFQDDLIRSYRAFLDKRRATRPAEEYREPTDQEWQEFQQHFQLRKVALGTCGRPYGASCQHEHACLRCAMLRVSPQQRPRLIEIIHNLHERVTEARMNVANHQASAACCDLAV